MSQLCFAHLLFVILLSAIQAYSPHGIFNRIEGTKSWEVLKANLSSVMVASSSSRSLARSASMSKSIIGAAKSGCTFVDRFPILLAHKLSKLSHFMRSCLLVFLPKWHCPDKKARWTRDMSRVNLLPEPSEWANWIRSALKSSFSHLTLIKYECRSLQLRRLHRPFAPGTSIAFSRSISCWYSRSRASFGSSLIFGLFFMFFARLAYLKAFMAVRQTWLRALDYTPESSKNSQFYERMATFFYYYLVLDMLNNTEVGCSNYSCAALRGEG